MRASNLRAAAVAALSLCPFAGSAAVLDLTPTGVVEAARPTNYWFRAKALDGTAYRGKSCVFEVTATGGRQVELTQLVEWSSKRSGYGSAQLRMRIRAGERTSRMSANVPDDVTWVSPRVDVKSIAPGVKIRLGRVRFGLADEFEPLPSKLSKPPEGPAKLLFHVPFDGTCDAAFAGGAAKPLAAENVAFAPGMKGQAAQLTSRTGSRLEYALAGNVLPERGAVSLWAKLAWPEGRASAQSDFFAFPMDDAGYGRWGSGALWFWWDNGTLRADIGDEEDCQIHAGRFPDDGRWHHYAFTWDETSGLTVWRDGVRRGARRPLGGSPMELAKHAERELSFARPDFRSFFVGGGPWGSSRGVRSINGFVDELKIWDRPIGADEIAAETKGLLPPATTSVDYAKVFADVPNPHLKPLPPGAPAGVPTDLELVEEVRFDRLPDDPKRFRVTGETRFGELGGVRYLELDPQSRRGRCALRFTLDPAVPLYVFEVDYPDDRKRTADVAVQRAKFLAADYTLQTGYLTGDEYPLSGKIRTLRCVYWTSAADVALTLMTARRDAPAAVSAVRLYRVRDGRLPAASVVEPPADADGWRRSVGLYYEDPAIGQDFGTPDTEGGTVGDAEKTIDRCIALMKFTGENLLAYPGSWYGGVIGGEYSPRPHVPDFLNAWYAKFDRAGLGFMPTMNVHDMDIPDGVVTFEHVRDGSLHASPITILETGLPPGAGTHGTPPTFCFYHPDVRRNIRRQLDTLLEQGLGHPSFRGIVLHLTLHPFLHWGHEAAGYNDYCIDGFTRDTGVPVPVDRRDPLRGKAYAAWLRAHAWDRWLKWRCDKVTEFYGDFARHMHAKRPDLRLWFNSCLNANWWPWWAFARREFGEPGWVGYEARTSGLDPAALEKAAPNIIVGQTVVPADYRWRHGDQVREDRISRYQRDLDRSADLWWMMPGAKRPFAHIWDRYWEDDVGRRSMGRADQLTGDWFVENTWRVSTINATGRQALRPYAMALRFSDALGITKGGYLVGTLGMEDVLAPWLQAFRALPPVKMRDVPGRQGGDVVLRRADWRGATYWQVLNVTDREATLEFAFPPGAADAVTGEALRGRTLRLAPYELRAVKFASAAAGI